VGGERREKGRGGRKKGRLREGEERGGA